MTWLARSIGPLVRRAARWEAAAEVDRLIERLRLRSAGKTAGAAGAGYGRERIAWVHPAEHGWLIQPVDRDFVVVVRILERGGEALEEFVDRRPGDVGSLLILLEGEALAPEFLNAIEDAVVRALEIGERVIRLSLQKIEDNKLHVALKQIERRPRCEVFDPGKVLHRVIPLKARIAARAEAAARNSMWRDYSDLTRSCPPPRRATMAEVSR
jgi:hypothetical protein